MKRPIQEQDPVLGKLKRYYDGDTVKTVYLSKFCKTQWLYI